MTTKRARQHSKKPKSQPESPKSKHNSTAAIGKFIVIFVCVSAAGVGLESYLMANDSAQAYRAFVASAGNGLAHLIGINSHVNQSQIRAGSRVLVVTPECSGIEAAGVFLAGVLAFPCGRRNTVIGIAFGLIGVGLLNILRVTGLIVVSDWSSTWFESVHDALTHLFPLFVVLPLWLVWLSFVVRSRRSQPKATRSI